MSFLKFFLVLSLSRFEFSPLHKSNLLSNLHLLVLLINIQANIRKLLDALLDHIGYPEVIKFYLSIPNMSLIYIYLFIFYQFYKILMALSSGLTFSSLSVASALFHSYKAFFPNRFPIPLFPFHDFHLYSFTFLFILPPFPLLHFLLFQFFLSHFHNHFSPSSLTFRTLVAFSFSRSFCCLISLVYCEIINHQPPQPVPLTSPSPTPSLLPFPGPGSTSVRKLESGKCNGKIKTWINDRGFVLGWYTHILFFPCYFPKPG